MTEEIIGTLPDKIEHLVMFSGGVCSWAAAKRAAEKHGTEGMVCLFADTLIEDPTLYTFLHEAATNVGAPLVKIADGRTPFEVFRDVRYLANTRADPCSRILKRELLNKWREDNCDPNCVTHFGLDWNEAHRLRKVRSLHDPWTCDALMTDRPWMSKSEMIEWATKEGLTPCNLYAEGFPHANCGGGCVKAGIAHWAHLKRMRPATFKRWRDEEAAIREELGDVAILRDRTGGEVKPLTLAALEERIDGSDQPELFDDWGGCGCAVE